MGIETIAPDVSSFLESVGCPHRRIDSRCVRFLCEKCSHGSQCKRIPPLGQSDGCFAQTASIGELPCATEFLGLIAIGNSVFPMATCGRWPPALRARIVKGAARRAA
jgi:hypothetical protein